QPPRRASVVALGESVHTTRGYSEAKDRLFRYLVTELGFRVMAFESPRTAARRVGRYVDTCVGEASAEVTRGLFGVWANQSVLELVEWMCAWNRAQPDDPVRFVGFDIQQPWADFGALRSVLQPMGAEATPLIDALDGCEGAGASSAANYYRGEVGQIRLADHRSCLGGLDALDAYVAAERDRIVASTDASDVEELERALIGIRAFHLQSFYSERNALNPTPSRKLSYVSRDRGMARIALRQRDVDFPGQKIAIWAHNSHISRAHHQVEGYWGGARSMGTFMAEALADDYFALMVTGHDVSINWPGIGVGPAAPVSDRQSLEAKLHRLDSPFLLVDLVDPGAELPFVASDPLAFAHGLGSGVPRDQFQAVLFIEVVEMMRRL
ncbi:MAG: erythromycin esterase family protein, partial [Myxococcota bacterium]